MLIAFFWLANGLNLNFRSFQFLFYLAETLLEEDVLVLRGRRAYFADDSVKLFDVLLGHGGMVEQGHDRLPR